MDSVSRTEQYKEDSTRGKSLLMPKKYKNDAHVQVWIDSRKLATLSRWLDENGLVTRFLSDVVRLTLDQVVASLTNEGKFKLIESCAEAREMLERKYRVNLNPRGRGEKNLLHNLVLDSRKNNSDVEDVEAGRSNLSKNSSGVKVDETNWDSIQKKIKEETLKEAKELVRKVKFDDRGLNIPVRRLNDEELSRLTDEREIKDREEMRKLKSMNEGI